MYMQALVGGWELKVRHSLEGRWFSVVMVVAMLPIQSSTSIKP